MGNGAAAAFNKRSPEMQALFDRVAPLIASGASIDAMAEKFNCDRKTLRQWSWRIKKRKAKENKLLLPVEARKLLDNAVNTSSELEAQVAAVVATRVKEALIQQSLTPFRELQLLRSEVGGILRQFHERIAQVISIIPQEIDEKIISAKDAATTIDKLLKTFTDLHCLPLGAQKVEAFKQAGPAQSQHLHYHAHGSRAQAERLNAKPLNTPKAPKQDNESEVIDVPVIEVSSENLSTNQVLLMEEL